MGLIGGIARTAVVAGTATAVSNRVSRRQAQRWADQGQQYTPVQRVGYTEAPAPVAAPAPAAPEPDRYEQLKQLAQLKDQGVLTEQEFAAEKQRILAG